MFHFELKENQDFVFRNGHWLLGPFELYINRLSFELDPEEEVPLVTMCHFNKKVFL